MLDQLRSCFCHLAIGYPVALEAKAEERETRGFTSIVILETVRIKC